MNYRYVLILFDGFLRTNYSDVLILLSGFLRTNNSDVFYLIRKTEKSHLINWDSGGYIDILKSILLA